MPRVQSATLLPIGSARIGPVELDCALEETHTWPSSVTRVPVESGATRSQHIVDMPYTLQLVGVISEYSIDPRKQSQQVALNLASSRVRGYQNTVPGQAARRNQAWDAFDQISGNAARYAGPFNPANAVKLHSLTQALSFQRPEYSSSDQMRVALARILALRESREPFDYVSPLGVIENLVFENLEIPVDLSGDLVFRARLVEFVETGLTRSRSLAISQEDASGEAANIGSRTTVEADFQALLAS